MQDQSKFPNTVQPPVRAGVKSHYAAAALIFLFTSALVYLTIAVRFPVNSDNMYFLLAAEDLLNGNFTLRGWHGGFFSALTGDIALAAIFRALISRKAALYLIGPLSCGVIAACGHLLIRRRTASRRISFLLTTPLIFIPRAIWHPMSTLGMHAVSIAQIFFLTYACDRLASKAETAPDKTNRVRAFFSWLGFTLMITLGCIADGFVLYFFAVPLFAAALFDFAITRRRTSVFFAMCAALGAGLSKAFLFFLEKGGGLKLTQSATQLVPFSEIGRYLFNALETWTRFFSPTPEKPFADQFIGVQLISLLLGGTIFALIVLRAIDLIRNWNASAFVDKLLVASAAFVAGSFAFTTVTQGEPAFRYLAPAYFPAIVIAAQGIGTVTKPSLRRVGIALMGAAALLNVSFNVQLRPASDIRLVEIADALKDRGVTRVYGTYWESLALTYYSGNAIQGAPITGVDGLVRSSEWSSKESWYQPEFGARCLLVEENQRDGLSTSLITDFFGAENEFLNYHQVEIRCYDRNLSELFTTQK